MERYGDMVFRLACSYLKNRADAEDVMQETLLKLYVQPPFDSPEHQRYWVVRVAVNECKRLLRSPWRRRTAPLEDLPEAAALEDPAQSQLLREVMALPARYRAAVYLYYYEGYSVREIGEALGAGPSTVQTWLMRARGQLRANLKEAESL